MPCRNFRDVLVPFLSLLVAGATSLSAIAGADSLEAGFREPPASARPHTWWHWMNGNVTREGITADLEAMKRVGIGGAQIFNVDCEIPPGPVKMLSPEWHAMMEHAVKEADRLGIELCLHNCGGWSSSGGPWNTPANAMQQLTFSEQRVEGRTHFTGALPLPPRRLDYYRDVAVLAYRVSGGEPTVKRLPTPKDAMGGAGSLFGERRAATAETGILPPVPTNGFVGDATFYSPSQSRSGATRAVPPSEVLNLTSRLQPDGRLDWKVPAGSWTILRIGHTPTGRSNHPAPPEGTGLECDKLSREAFDAHWSGFVQKVLDDAGPLAGAGKALNNVLIDSYEVGGQNWTPKFREAFQKRRGYDPIPFLPVVAGISVQNAAVTERFRWDMRRTIADLFAENYYGRFQELCRERGLQASIEPYSGPFESLECGGKADIPMGEFWIGSKPDPSVKLAASVGHIYGLPVIGAESFTASPGAQHGRWMDDAYAMKSLGDLVFCQGVNRFIFHRYAMQPWTNRWPGMTMGQWGSHFDRTSTWWEQSRAWLQYVARCQFLLQRGQFVADAAYFTGESEEIAPSVGEQMLPVGYDADGINAEVLLRQASVKNGRLVLKSGMSYALLILPPSDHTMSPALLKQLGGFVSNGLTVAGPPPDSSPGLQDYPRCDTEVKRLAARIWGDCNGRTITEHAFGKGKVVWGLPLGEVLQGLKVEPDFECSDASAAQLVFIHRSDGDAQLYFVSNQRARYETVECSFRQDGKAPELWNPETGTIEPAPVWRTENGRTTVRLSFDPAGSVFVVFRYPPRGDHLVAVQSGDPAATPDTPKAAELKIIKAVYGVPGSPDQSWLAVTDQVKAQVAAGNRRIVATTALAGEDPAPNVLKRLRVEFLLNGKQQALEAQEGDALELPAGAEVTAARYGDLQAQSAHKVDVTAKLARLVKGGELSVTADNSLAGTDPAYGVPKVLSVDYSLDGVVKRATIPENGELTLPESTRTMGSPLSFAFAAGADGGERLMAWAPGSFSLAWSSGRKSEVSARELPAASEVAGPWEVRFPPGWGAPDKATLERLQSWTVNEDPGVKYFSGTATYVRDLEVPAELMAMNREIWLDLGEVKNFAEVSLNGQPLGILWKPPFRVNVTSAARAGTNTLEIKVTNLWPNRLIGDEQLPADTVWRGKQLAAWPAWLLEGKPSPSGRLTFTTWHHWTRSDALLPSGLLGPVTIQAVEEIPLR